MRHPLRVYKDDAAKGECSDRIWMHFYYKILNLYLVRFKYTGLPDYIPPQFMERVLFYRGVGAFIYDDVVDKFAFMRTALTGLPDIYDIPEIRQVYTANGYIEDYSKWDSVLVWDNPSALPWCYTAAMYADRLATAMKTIDTNLFAQRTPVVLACTVDERLTYESISDQYEAYVPIIRVDDTVDLDRIKTLKLDAPYVVDKIYAYMNTLWSQVLTDLGYESNPIDKKERLISQEVQGNNGETEGERHVALDMRRRAFDAINKVFGLNVQVEFNTELPTPLNGYGPYDKTREGDVNGSNDSEDL